MAKSQTFSGASQAPDLSSGISPDEGEASVLSRALHWGTGAEIESWPFLFYRLLRDYSRCVHITDSQLA